MKSNMGCLPSEHVNSNKCLCKVCNLFLRGITLLPLVGVFEFVPELELPGGDETECGLDLGRPIKNELQNILTL